MGLRLYDAHNHLQDERLKPVRPVVIQILEQENIAGMVVNGSCEEDWPAVLDLARHNPQVIPSFGYHPWYLQERSADWQHVLIRFLDQVPSGVGEIGLDRWWLDARRTRGEGYGPTGSGSGIGPPREQALREQEEVFIWQLRLAAERNLPVSIHCLQAWGRLLELLEAGPRPQCGFVLHSFGGPQEMIQPLARLGAYFSLPGYFAHERKRKQREAFRHVPLDRFLIETDAPDQLLPEERVRYPLLDEQSGKPLNHPANLGMVYAFAAELLGEPVEAVAERVEENFQRLFGALVGKHA